jgi:hypothetical protein
MKDNDFLVAEEVANLLRCSKSYAYKIMKRVNDERKKAGYIVLRGRVPKKALLERVGLA